MPLEFIITARCIWKAGTLQWIFVLRAPLPEILDGPLVGVAAGWVVSDTPAVCHLHSPASCFCTLSFVRPGKCRAALIHFLGKGRSPKIHTCSKSWATAQASKHGVGSGNETSCSPGPTARDTRYCTGSDPRWGCLGLGTRLDVHRQTGAQKVFSPILLCPLLY